MKEVTQPLGARQAKFTINPELDKYEPTAYFRKKDEEAFAFLKKYPPTEWLRKITNERIERDFNDNMSLDAIAESHKLTHEDVLSRLEEMGLVEPVVA